MLLVLELAAVAPAALAQDAGDIRIGHWIEVKGQVTGPRAFEASSVELHEPANEEVLVGNAERVSVSGEHFFVMGQRVTVSERTDWRDLSLANLEGQRVKVEGHYRSPGKFSARSIGPRPPGRERLEGRVDDIVATPKGIEVRIMDYRVLIRASEELQHEEPLNQYPLAPARPRRTGLPRRTNEDNYIPLEYRIGRNFLFGARLEWEHLEEDNFNLDNDNPEDRTDDELSLRAQLAWNVSDRFYAFGGFRSRVLFRDDEEDGFERVEVTRLTQLYGYYNDFFLRDLDVQVGRQDFDEQREWLYDEFLDAARLLYVRPAARLELSASTVISDGRPRDEATDNFIAYLSNNDEDRLLAAYVVDRRTDFRGVKDYPIHLGFRALGEWIPDNDIWLEYSLLRGYTDNIDIEAYGFDVGTTWKPSFAKPLYVNVGYAFGSGDPDPTDDRDRTFRQTGLQDNNSKLGGVTSLRYYGELVDPELSNMGILTLGIGTRFGVRNSLDLLYHSYVQDVAADRLLDTDIDRRPDGVHRDLGWELDLVLGVRSFERFDIKLALGMFEPGAAFPDGDTAYLGKFRVRFRF